jgi:hypothetical protein
VTSALTRPTVVAAGRVGVTPARTGAPQISARAGVSLTHSPAESSTSMVFCRPVRAEVTDGAEIAHRFNPASWSLQTSGDPPTRQAFAQRWTGPARKGTSASRQAAYPPTTSVARHTPSSCSAAAARLEV